MKPLIPIKKLIKALGVAVLLASNLPSFALSPNSPYGITRIDRSHKPAWDTYRNFIIGKGW